MKKILISATLLLVGFAFATDNNAAAANALTREQCEELKAKELKDLGLKTDKANKHNKGYKKGSFKKERKHKEWKKLRKDKMHKECKEVQP